MWNSDGVEIMAYEDGVPGLLLHRVPTGWQVSHHSGLSILRASLPTRKLAAEAMAQLGSLTDWTPEPESLDLTGVGRRPWEIWTELCET